MSDENSKTILLVEAAKSIAKNEKTALEKYGYKVIISNSGKEALNIIENKTSIDLMLMDINLSEGIYSWETSGITSKINDVPVVLMLNPDVSPETIEKIKEIKFYGFIDKNSSPAFFDASIKMALNLFESRIIEQEYIEFRKRAFESSIVPMVVMDSRTYGFIDCNPAAAAIYRFHTCEETIGKTPLDVSAPVQYDGSLSADKAKYYIDKALAEGQTVFEWRHKRPDGEIWDAEVHLMSFVSRGRKFLQFTLRDITERKLAEDELNKSLLRYKTLVDNSPDIIARFDNNIHYLFVNSSISRVSPFKSDYFIGKTMHEVGFTDYEADQRESLVRQVFNNGTSVETEFEFTGLNGRRFYDYRAYPEFDLTGKVQSVLTINRDITERKKAENELKASEENYRYLFNNSPVGIFQRKLDGEFIFFNDAEIKNFECRTREEYLENYGDSSKHFENPEELVNYQESLIKNKSVRNFEATALLKNGKRKWFLLSANYDDLKSVVNGFSMDITKRVQAETALKTQTRLQELLMKMSAGFINMPLEKIEYSIDNSLEEIGVFVEADRVHIADYNLEADSFTVTHEWCHEGIKPVINIAKNVKLASFPDFDLESFRLGNPVFIPDTGLMPQGPFRNFLETGDSRSLIIVPMMNCGLISGFANFAWVRRVYKFSGFEEDLLLFFSNMLVNIQQRMLANISLHESEQNYRYLFDFAGDGILILQESEIFDCNLRAVEMIGLDRDKIIGHSILDFSPEFQKGSVPSKTLAIEKITEALEGKPQRFEWEYIRSGGHHGIVEATLYPIRLKEKLFLQAFLRDVTERVHSEEALMQSENKYRSLYENAFHAIYRSTPQGTIISANPAAVRLFGYTSEEEAISSITDFGKQHFANPEELKKMLEILAQNGSIENYEIECRSKDGKTIWILLNARTVTAPDGTVEYIDGVVQDITERKAVEENLIAAYESLKKANNDIRFKDQMLLRSERLSSLGQLSSAIAHEIRQPLNNIRLIAEGFLFWKDEKIDISFDDIFKGLSDISRNVDRMDKTLKTMMNMVRAPERIESKPVLINQVIRDTLSLLDQQIKDHGIDLRLELDEEMEKIDLSEVQIQQVFINIISNAVEILKDYGRKEKIIRIETSDLKEKIVISIGDNGPGVPAENRGKIFNPFFSTYHSGENAGLGLYIVHTIIKSYNSEIFIKDNEMGGATFVIELNRRQKT